MICRIGLTLLAAVSLYAQSSQKLVVQIPFEFSAGIAVLPAGEYTVETDIVPGVVRLRSTDHKSAAMIISQSVETLKTPNDPKLVFNRYGDQYFLWRVWKAGNNIGKEFRPAPREMEMAAVTPRQELVLVARK
ncbi:MAG: hypothetical protein HYR60_04895 [Acidobacteria bacterium]|nr:hypothetical protein [Acidobacteriota bacterium]